jgi:hypothetical protein
MTVCISAILALASAVCAQTATVVLRGREAPLLGDVREVTFEAITLDTSGTTRIIGWDRVWELAGTEPVSGDMLAFARGAWQGRTRTEKGDYSGAEAVLESLLPRCIGKRGPTVAAISGSLLECRLSRGAYAQAILPMLVYAGAVSSGRDNWYEPATPVREPRLDRIPDSLRWDESFALCPLVPPLWVDVPSVRALVETKVPDQPPRAAMLGALYRASAAREVGIEFSLPDVIPDDPGLRLVAEVVLAQDADPAIRQAARQMLTRRQGADTPAWLDAWCRAAIGRSLLREPEREERLLGVAELLAIPALYERLNPALTGVCLAHAAVALDDLGHSGAARSLVEELAQRFPAHPVLSWDRLGRIGRSRDHSGNPQTIDESMPGGSP